MGMRRLSGILCRYMSCAAFLFLLPAGALAADRPRPGDPVRVRCLGIAEPGTFETTGDFALRARPTRRGYEAVWMRVPTKTGARHFLYSPPADRVIRWAEDPGELQPVPPPAASRLRSFLPASCVTGHPAWKRWAREEFPGSPLAKGVAYAAKNREDGLHLLVDAVAEPAMRDYGPIFDGEGRPLGLAVALTAGDNGDLYLLTVSNRDLVLAVIEDVFVDELMDLRTRAVLQHFARALPSATRVHSLSITAMGEHLDRGYDSLAAASDGNIYFGTMPHHPTRGTAFFRYLPAQDRIETLGDLDRMPNAAATHEVPSMMHTTPVEIDGALYITGQDPFYGQAGRFPELPDDAGYAGSRILAYELNSGRWRDLGIPFPGVSVFAICGIDGTGRLYVKTGYERGAVHAFEIASGRLTPALFVASSNSIVVGQDGALYLPQGDSLVRHDPETGTQTVVAAIEAPVAWIKGQHGRREILGIAADAVVRLDTATGELRTVGRFDRAPRAGDSALHDGRVYRTSLEGGGQGQNRAVRLLSFDLATGATRNHGFLIDEEDRIVQEVFAMDAGADGTIYMQGTVFPKAGDAYSPRLRRYFLNENRFLVLRP